MSSSPFKLRAVGAAVCVAALLAMAACSSSGTSGSSSSSSNSGTVTVAVVSNPLITNQMIPLTASNFEKQNPGIKVKFATYTEGDLRAAIEKNVSTHSNAFNVIMIGPYETPLFAKNGWLTDLSKQYIASDPSYDAADLLPPVAKALSYQGDLYAAPFYGESSMLYYNKALLKAAGVTLPLHPTWTQVQAAAAKVNQPGKVSGICLRGLAGWGDNMAALDTVINTFGGEWYNPSWQAQLNSPATTAAINFYVNLVKQYGEPGASNDSFNQLLTLYGQGKCAMWYDATVAATSIAGTYPQVFANTGYAFASLGAVLGDQFGYMVGRWGDRKLTTRVSRWLGSEERLAQAEAHARKWGGVGVFITRWLATPLGPLVNLTSGFAGYPWHRFLIWDIIGETLWVGLYVGVGEVFSHRVQALSGFFAQITWTVAAIFVALLLSSLLFRPKGAGRQQ